MAMTHDTPAPADASSEAATLRANLLELAGFAALAILLTWPLALRCATHLPLGQEPTDTVVVLNAWTLWWNADRIDHGLAGYWNAPIFYPEPHTFVLGEPQPVSGLLTWPLWHLLGMPAAYNLLLLGHLTLNGWFGRRFLRALDVTPPADWIGGAWLASLPLVLTSLGVFQVVPIWSVLWTLTAASRFMKQPSRLRAAEIGIALAITYGMNCHYGLFLLSLLPLWIVGWLGHRRSGPREVARLGTALLVFAVLVSPMLLRQWKELRQARRKAVVVRAMSATVPRYLHSPYLGQSREMPVRRLGIGPLKYAAAFAGVAWLWRRRERRRLCPLLLLAIGGMVLSMAPRLGYADNSLATCLAEYVPGMGAIRNWFRYALFVQVALVAAASMLVAELPRCCGFIRQGRAGRCWGLAGILLLGVAESWPGLGVLAPAPPVPEWARWLGRHDRGSVLAVVPLGRGGMAVDHRRSALAMYWQPVHGCRLLNGYNGYFPDSQRTVLPALRRLPDRTSLNVLEQAGVRYLVVYGSADEPVMRDAGWKKVLPAGADGAELWSRSSKSGSLNRRAGVSRSTRSPAASPIAAVSPARSDRDLP